MIINRLKKINFSLEQYNAVKTILQTQEVTDENYQLLDNSPIIYNGKKHWAEISTVDLENIDFQFTIDVYCKSEDNMGEWIYSLVAYDNIDNFPKTYEEFINLLDERFMSFDEMFVNEYISSIQNVEQDIDKDITDEM